MSTQPRKPAGAAGSTGGQYAETPRAEADIVLREDRPSDIFFEATPHGKGVNEPYEQIAATRRQRSDPRPLCCPYCLGSVSVDARIDSYRMDVDVSVECDSIECGAQFAGSGAPTRTPAQFQDEVDALVQLHRG